MRCVPLSVANTAVSLLLLASMLIVGAVQWNAAPASATEIGPRFAVAEPASELVLLHEAAAQVERKVKKDASAGAPPDGLPVRATTLPPPPLRWSRVDPARAPPPSGLPSLRPEARAPPLTI